MFQGTTFTFTGGLVRLTITNDIFWVNEKVIIADCVLFAS